MGWPWKLASKMINSWITNHEIRASFYTQGGMKVMSFSNTHTTSFKILPTSVATISSDKVHLMQMQPTFHSLVSGSAVISMFCTNTTILFSPPLSTFKYMNSENFAKHISETSFLQHLPSQHCNLPFSCSQIIPLPIPAGHSFSRPFFSAITCFKCQS